MKNKMKATFVIFVSFLLFESCMPKEKQAENAAIKKEVTTLKKALEKDFYIGAAINGRIIDKSDTSRVKLLQEEFNSITAENDMKWMYIHPDRNSFNFDQADRFVSLGEQNNMHMVGHTLVWHSQLAGWVSPIKDSSELALVLKEHISEIVGRYKGRIDSWDVVNEALNEDGSLRESIFSEVLGPDFIKMAFRLAAEADPDAKLIYNDYNLWKPEKRAGVVALVKKLQAGGTKIDGVGMQAHWGLEEPAIQDIENSILAYDSLGVKVRITELDITVLRNPWDLDGAAVDQDYRSFEGDSLMNPFPEKFPDSMQVKLSKRYQDIFRLFLKHKDKISRVTFWGLDDGPSWLNNWPIRGRTNYPLLFDRNLERKSAYDSILELKQDNN